MSRKPDEPISETAAVSARAAGFRWFGPVTQVLIVASMLTGIYCAARLLSV